MEVLVDEYRKMSVAHFTYKIGDISVWHKLERHISTKFYIVAHGTTLTALKQPLVLHITKSWYFHIYLNKDIIYNNLKKYFIP